ncbi:DivIVA domain-containing protein [Actinosynnema sp. NPDC023658]|uniref:DivIVA domain-containing protein n=1 Tax=Actinosynnema sp. NPDC023658 TaxID=3155465 RepID=UPI0033DD2C23
MTSALFYIVIMALVAAVVFLLAALVFGRGEELAPLPPGASPTRLPSDDVTPADVRDLKFQQVLRGYKMTEVDWALDRLAGEVERLRARVTELEAELGVEPSPHATPAALTPGRSPDRSPDGDPDRESDREPERDRA